MCPARRITLLDRVERKIIMCCTTCKHQPELFIHSHCCRSLLKYVEPCELMLLYNVSRTAYNIIGSRGTKNHNMLREKCKHFSRGTTYKHPPELFIHSHCSRSLLKYRGTKIHKVLWANGNASLCKILNLSMHMVSTI